MTIKDKVVVITGASSGIGAASAKLLLKSGAHLVLGARRTERLQLLTEGFEKQAIFQKTDVREQNSVQSLIDLAVNTFGRIDVLFNNAGIMPIANLSANHHDEWESMIQTNVMGVLNGISAVIPVMHKQGSGQIITTDSVAGHVVFPGYAVYCGTKFAVRAIMDGLRKEEHSNGIKTTIISPGASDTELYRSNPDPVMANGLIESWHENDDSSLKPEDVAEALLYAIDTPQHVNVNEILVRPLGQGD
ncbi:SDR family oxidoreductase [Xylocopilactobacillus apis]|uniref:Oxidoreductase n=1 Tax=Xylocopilactobacillus apis TaxID=2932183 RepID=A0AAU9CS80_9LACO|nr:SDR family oxidoreductase [Xylocopilactobacillus apis]BDR56819.1 oxidoreductase [Xylocopilactobacillus apis]